MDKQLQELSKEELISIIQDYQEMVSDIEEVLNSLDERANAKIRDILERYL